MLTNRISIFISLPMRSLDQLALQKQLDAIGKITEAPSKPGTAAE
jgi:arsenate reductase